MNKWIIIGNLCDEPDMRTTPSGINVTNFTVAVNKRRKAGEEQETDYVKVTAWRQLAEHCKKYLCKGKKVCVIGEASADAFISKKTNQPKASLGITAQEVEFLSTGSTEHMQQPVPTDAQTGMQVMEQENDLPF